MISRVVDAVAPTDKGKQDPTADVPSPDYSKQSGASEPGFQSTGHARPAATDYDHRLKIPPDVKTIELLLMDLVRDRASAGAEVYVQMFQVRGFTYFRYGTIIDVS
jgi:hypothetical protein